MKGKYIFLMLLMMMVALPANSAAQEFVPAESLDIWVDPLHWYTRSYSNCEDGARIYGDFEVVSGGSIDFFVCD